MAARKSHTLETFSVVASWSGFVVTILESNEDSGCNARFARARATTKSAGASGVELGLKQF